MSQELAPRPAETEAAYGLELAEKIFTPERREQISGFIGVTADDPAFVPFLAIAASTGLDPLTGEIWLIKGKRRKVKDGAGKEQWIDNYRPAAGRDGFLKVARRHAEFLGVESDVVHAFDTFAVRRREPDDPTDLPEVGGGRVVVHEYPELQESRKLWAEAEAAKPEDQRRPWDSVRYRGPVIGAWAVAKWRGRTPVYFYASIAEYGRTKEEDGHKSWEGAWSFTSAMLLKAAVSYVLRISSGISGIVPVDEVLDRGPEQTIEEIPTAELPDWASNEQRAEFDEALAYAAEVDPNLWNPAKVQMYIGALREPVDLDKLIARIQSETSVEADRQAAASPGPEPEVVEDAEVVE